MIENSKKYIVTTENSEIFILRRNIHKPSRGHCAECGTEVEMLTLDEVSAQTEIGTRELFRMIENNSLHSIETPNGQLLVCINSINK